MNAAVVDFLFTNMYVCIYVFAGVDAQCRS